jgi:hypothetical protein
VVRGAEGRGPHLADESCSWDGLIVALPSRIWLPETVEQTKGLQCVGGVLSELGDVCFRWHRLRAASSAVPAPVDAQKPNKWNEAASHSVLTTAPAGKNVLLHVIGARLAGQSNKVQDRRRPCPRLFEELFTQTTREEDMDFLTPAVSSDAIASTPNPDSSVSTSGTRLSTVSGSSCCSSPTPQVSKNRFHVLHAAIAPAFSGELATLQKSCSNPVTAAVL